MRSRRLEVSSLISVVALALSCAPRAAGPVSSGGDGETSSAPAAPVAGNLLKASTFDDGVSVPWTTSFTAPADGSADVKSGALCVTVKNKGTNNWDAQFRHREMVIQRGHTYTVAFKAWASEHTKARPKVGMSGPPYAEYWNATIDIGTEPKRYQGAFTMEQADDGTAEFAFHIGGGMARADLPFEICIDDVVLSDPEFTPVADRGSVKAPNVLVNQLGYLPGAAKVATVKASGKEPLAWRLLDAGGKAVAEGKTTPFGRDAASGDDVQLVDFSSVKAPGKGYVLEVGTDKSFAFDIGSDVYTALKYDALAFFYQNRSGIEIRKDLVGDPTLARPAGHLGDKSAKCAKNAGCDYSVDGAGGWYDAGDHGKYVVNGGISVWTLLDEYERSVTLGSSSADFGDGKLRIPEKSNGAPDLLDEARWELEWLLKMQVPAGKPLAGMAHHKLQDVSWTALATAPHEDTQPRVVFKPSTAATLNLAATAAQGARLWKPFDAAFSAKCLKAAEVAWVAAKANPKLLANKNDTDGGGAYEDAKVDDDFYWAAAELLATTGKPEYRQFVEGSPLHRKLRMEAGGHTSTMNWADTDALGLISLAVAKGVDPGLQAQARKQLTGGADRYLDIIAKQGYRSPLEPAAGNRYVWGSNSFVINNLIVVALAYDFTKQQKYLDGVATGMDYLLGRNPLGQSYVTGYGEKALQHPHHRFWAKQANAKYPSAPPGILSGGPNSNIDDPYAKAAGLKGCAPQKCFVDHIEAYSVNEITINWNAPLAWVSAWLDEKARAN
ncbi:MAG: endoglucanase [Myxococcales bacterium]|nr:MAG: endoglucanase [Myxococcales bacterium]